ncbi:L,D-transpeptidase family protein [Sulfurimonas sp. HSL1-2]|uniref:L,D-transpeptidase family protein n=1 Tax=Thiomicrolovo zhangzhouensis TaxID=3131933 RepID=UPI0031FA0F0F
MYALGTLQENNDTLPVATVQLPGDGNTTSVSPDPVGLLIRDFVEDNATLRTILPTIRPSLIAFYTSRAYAPLWSNERGCLPGAEALSQMIDGIAEEGLDPTEPFYHGKAVRTLLQTCVAPDDRQRTELDLLLTDAFLALAHDLHYGRAYGSDLNCTSEYNALPIDPAHLLNDDAVRQNIRQVLLSVAPQDIGYQRLRTALNTYRRLDEAGGWSTRTADYADDGNISRRLQLTGDLVGSADPDPEAEKQRLLQAVKRFQGRHGITVDGVVGPVTASKLALSPSALIAKIRLNMERWKWLPPHGDGPYIIVNVPGFTLEVRRADQQELQMRAIVGRRDRETPIFASRMQYIVLNPYWRVPETILNEDLIPKLVADPHYLTKKKIKLFSAADTTESQPIDPLTVDWSKWHERDTKRYVFREDPGAENPLGYVKFLFNNPYDIYIHDTPAHSLFKNSNGSFSSGCIRVRKPFELARYLLSLDDPEVTYKSLLTLLLSGENRWLRLKNTLPVYITYQTAAVDDEGTVRFYNDIYGCDRKLIKYIKNK